MIPGPRTGEGAWGLWRPLSASAGDKLTSGVQGQVQNPNALRALPVRPQSAAPAKGGRAAFETPRVGGAARVESRGVTSRPWGLERREACVGDSGLLCPRRLRGPPGSQCWHLVRADGLLQNYNPELSAGKPWLARDVPGALAPGPVRGAGSRGRPTRQEIAGPGLRRALRTQGLGPTKRVSWEPAQGMEGVLQSHTRPCSFRRDPSGVCPGRLSQTRVLKPQG